MHEIPLLREILKTEPLQTRLAQKARLIIPRIRWVSLCSSCHCYERRSRSPRYKICEGCPKCWSALLFHSLFPASLPSLRPHLFYLIPIHARFQGVGSHLEAPPCYRTYGLFRSSSHGSLVSAELAVAFFFFLNITASQALTETLRQKILLPGGLWTRYHIRNLIDQQWLPRQFGLPVQLHRLVQILQRVCLPIDKRQR